MSLIEKLLLADILVSAAGFAAFRYLATREAIKQGAQPTSAVVFRWAVGAKGKARTYRDLAFAWMIFCFLVAMVLMALFAER